MKPTARKRRTSATLILFALSASLAAVESCGRLADDPPFASLVAAKIAAREGGSDPDFRGQLFLLNVQRFHARHYVPPGGLTLPQAVGRAAEDFVRGALAAGAASATARSDGRLRATDLEEALRAAAPSVLDTRNDHVFFPHLSSEERVVVDPRDLDATAETGLAWGLLGVMLEAGRIDVSLDPDAPAAELLADALNTEVLLLLRIAGGIARTDSDLPFVSGREVDAAAVEIRRRAGADAASAESRTQESPQAPKAEESGFMREVTTDLGVAFQHRSSFWLDRFRRDVPAMPPTFSGGGLAAGDVDGDGRDDLLFVGGGGNALYRNEGARGFRRIADEALRHLHRDGQPAEARQPILADFDNDGHEDLLITYVDAPHRLLRNTGDANFEDVTARAGLGGEDTVEGAATVFDFDRDGLLDLYLCGFGDYRAGYAGQPPASLALEAFPGQLPLDRAASVNGVRNRLLRNLGGLRFEVLSGAGADDPGWCQAVTHTDLDGDGWQDLVIANDFGHNRLLRNDGHGAFEDVSEWLGAPEVDHSRGVGVADLNGDLLPDLYFSNINLLERARGSRRRGLRVAETSKLFLSGRSGEGVAAYALAESPQASNAAGWAWDAEFFDFDNDGDEDLYVVNGSSEYFVNLTRRRVGGETRLDWNREPNLLFENEGGRFRTESATGLERRANSRAAVFSDFDLDGDLDVAVNDFHGPAGVFRNEGSDGRHFLRLRLEGDPAAGSNRDAIGARLVVRTPQGKRLWREVRGGSGFLSMEPKVQHFGLGMAGQADVEIRWPGGAVQELRGLPADRTWSVREGDAPRLARGGGT